MSDDVDAQLAALEKAAPDTPDEPVTPNEPIEAKQTEQKQEAAPEGEQPQREPLSAEELGKRYEQTKAAMREERARRREYETKLKEAQATQERMERAFQQIQARVNQPQRPVEEQPFTYEDAVTEMWQERQETQAQRARREAAEAQQRQQNEQFNAYVAQINDTMNEYAEDFRDTHPDYDEATGFIETKWVEQFTEMGYDPNTAAAIAQQLAIAGIETVLKQRKNPAQVAYQVAQKLGYQRKNGVAPAANGAHPASAGAERLAQMKAGQEASQSLSGGGSSAQGGEMTLARIASLEGAAFDAAFDKFLKSAR